MRSIVGIICLLLAACVRQPDLTAPEVTVPAPEEWEAGQDVSGEVAPEWWKDFEDPQLTRLVERAIDSNYRLEAALARLDAARAQADAAGADLLPQVHASLNRTRQQQAFVGFPIPGSEENVLKSLSTNARGALEVSWEADLWGRIRAGEFAAAAAARAGEADLRAARQAIAAETARAWFTLTEVRLQTELAAITAASFEETVESVRLRYQRGLRPPLDLRLALSSYSSAEATLRERRAARDRAARRLEIILAQYPDADRTGQPALPALPGPPPVGLPADLVRRRPDVLAAEQRLAADHAGIVQARSALYPSFSLNGSAGFVSNTLVDVLTGDFSVWSYAGQLAAPLYQGGRLRANVRAAEAFTRESEATFANTVLRAFLEVEIALAAEEYLLGQREHVEEAVEQAIASADLAFDQYEAGLVDIITLLESQRRSLESQSRLISVQLSLLLNRVDLYLALGGGFPKTGNTVDGGG